MDFFVLAFVIRVKKVSLSSLEILGTLRVVKTWSVKVNGQFETELTFILSRKA